MWFNIKDLYIVFYFLDPLRSIQYRHIRKQPPHLSPYPRQITALQVLTGNLFIPSQQKNLPGSANIWLYIIRAHDNLMTNHLKNQKP